MFDAMLKNILAGLITPEKVSEISANIDTIKTSFLKTVENQELILSHINSINAKLYIIESHLNLKNEDLNNE